MTKLSDRILRMLLADHSLGNRSSRTEHAHLITNAEFPLVAEANLVHSVRLPEGKGVRELLREVEPALAAAGTPWSHILVDPGARPEALGELLERAGFRIENRIGAAYSGPPTAEPRARVDVQGIAEKSRWAQFSDLRRRIQAASGRSGEELEQSATLARRRSLSSNVRFYLAIQEFEPVGHVGLLAIGRSGMIVELAVSPEHRDRGIERELVRKMVEQSRSLGHDLTCLVHDQEAAAAAGFVNMGFEPVFRFRTGRLRTAR